MNTAVNPKSRLLSLVELNLNARITYVERKFWAEIAGMEYIQQLAFKQDMEAIRLSVDGNYYATCCFAAVSLHEALDHRFTTQYFMYLTPHLLLFE